MSDLSPSGVVRDKAVMRRAVLRARRSLGSQMRRRFDADIAAALAPLVRGRVVAGYVPMAGEPGGADLLAVLASASRLLLPVLREDRDLEWARFDGDLVPAAFGLSEPRGPRLGPSAVADASLLVVPAVAVDRRGMRLGRGGGSYDRALARAWAVPSLAVVYAAELLDDVPVEPHDRAVHGTVTETGVRWTQPVAF